MMLGALLEYAAEKGLASEPGFAPKEVFWTIALAQDGRYLGVVPLWEQRGKRRAGRTFQVCPELQQPEMKRGGAGCRHFLIDNLGVVALYDVKGDAKAKAKAEAKHDYFVNLLRRAAREIPLPELDLCAQAIGAPEILDRLRGDLQQAKARATENATFSIGDRYPVDGQDWHEWWRRFRRTLSRPDESESDAGTGSAVSVASGERCHPAATHPKISGLLDVGGLSTGDALISFKQDSFRSYGLEQSANAAVAETETAAYRAALDHLIVRTGRNLGGRVKVVYWFRGADLEGTEDDVFRAITEGADPAAEAAASLRARRLLQAIETGQRPELARARYVWYALSGASGRVMVRETAGGSFGELASAVAAWFDALAICRPDGSGLARDPKFAAVLGALIRNDFKELPPTLETALWRVATDARFPGFAETALTMALARIRSDILSDEPFRATRFGIVKAYLMRRHGDQEMRPFFNENHPSSAYHCGALLAVLAAVQRAALGDVGAGVVQRYYAAATTTPGLVLGRLLRGAQFHLDKLEPGRRSWFDQRIAAAVSRLGDEFPAVLDLKGQGLFALGYYQRIAADRQEAAAHKQAKQATAEPEEESNA